MPEPEYDHRVYSQHIGKTVRFTVRTEHKFAQFVDLINEGVIVGVIPSEHIPPLGYEIHSLTGYYRVPFDKILGEVVHRVAVEPLEGINE